MSYDKYRKSEVERAVSPKSYYNIKITEHFYVPVKKRAVEYIEGTKEFSATDWHDDIESREVRLLEQSVNELDLSKVIKAINNL